MESEMLCPKRKVKVNLFSSEKKRQLKDKSRQKPSHFKQSQAVESVKAKAEAKII